MEAFKNIAFVLNTLAHPIRLQILASIKDGKNRRKSIYAEILAKLKDSLKGMDSFDYHLFILRKANLIGKRTNPIRFEINPVYAEFVDQILNNEIAKVEASI